MTNARLVVPPSNGLPAVTAYWRLMHPTILVGDNIPKTTLHSPRPNSIKGEREEDPDSHSAGAGDRAPRSRDDDVQGRRQDVRRVCVTFAPVPDWALVPS